MESREYEKIMDLVDDRVQYMHDVGGFSQSKVNSISDIVKEVGYSSDELSEFIGLPKDSDSESEFRRLLIEAAASIVLMVTRLDEKIIRKGGNENYGKSMFQDILGGDLKAPSFINGGIVFDKDVVDKVIKDLSEMKTRSL